MSCDCYGSAALPQDAIVGKKCVIVVFPDHTYFIVAELNYLRPIIRYNLAECVARNPLFIHI